MKVGLFFGSFNPVHVGHMIIANYIVEHTSLDELWMIVSPQNPFKDKKSLARDSDRLHLVSLAIGDNFKIRASNVEFDLPKPSYTIDTLTHLKDKHPNKEFVLIMGGDNLGSFHKWKNYEVILKNHDIYVYQRPAYDLGELQDHPRITILEAPQMNISASYIRKEIKNKRNVRYLVPDAVFDYLENTTLYQ